MRNLEDKIIINYTINDLVAMDLENIWVVEIDG